MTRDTPQSGDRPILRAHYSLALIVVVIAMNVANTVAAGWLNWLLLASGLVVVLLIGRAVGLGRRDYGLELDYVVRGGFYGFAFSLVTIVVMGVAFVIRPELFMDTRYAVGWTELLRLCLVSIPLHTVLVEEMLFRGVLLAYLRQSLSDARALALCSAMFGLWHILPSLGIAASSQTLSDTVGAGSGGRLLSVVGVVLATSVAGYVFGWLRMRSRSLMAPFLAHWTINATGVIFAVLAIR